MKMTPQKPENALERKPKAGLCLGVLFPRISHAREGGETVRRSFLAILGQCVLLLALCMVLILTLVLTVSLTMVRLTAPAIVTTDTLPDGAEYDCILVLGAGVRADGTPSDMLRDRVSVAVELYKVTGAPLLMSGDHTGDYNEVGVMKALAVEMGVPSEDVFLDHEGYSTYESLYRAKRVFGARSILVVTQEYHLHRALYISRELGMKAEGVSADLRPYRKQTQYALREHLARFKDLFTAAKGNYEGHLDPPVDLDGDGDLT
ncbi:MAG: YdcF family protein [Clostridia bacterium]|nr:YdcF family protein [Clostridia bacterium]